jgi:hypothetical protein
MRSSFRYPVMMTLESTVRFGRRRMTVLEHLQWRRRVVAVGRQDLQQRPVAVNRSPFNLVQRRDSLLPSPARCTGRTLGHRKSPERRDLPQVRCTAAITRREARGGKHRPIANSRRWNRAKSVQHLRLSALPHVIFLPCASLRFLPFMRGAV